MLRSLFVSTFFGIAVVAPAALAETYYVAPNGSDDATGLADAPWATTQRAADTVAPGDTVIVQPGNYAGFQLETSGSEGSPITFSGMPGAVIDQNNPTTDDGINLEGASYVIVEGFHVIASDRAGIRAVECDRVTIRNNVSEQNFGWGILTGFCDNLLIEGNETFGSIDEHGIYVSNSGDNPIIRGNLIHDNNANGIHMNGDISLGGDGIISNALVEANIIFNNGANGGSGINCDGVQDSLIQNNLLYASHASGISLYQIDGGGPSTNNTVVNNTVLVADNGRWALNIQNASTGNTALNNIFLSDHVTRGSIDISADSLQGFSSDYNVVVDVMSNDGNFVALAEWQTATGQDTNSFVASAAELFVDPAGADYHLLATGPAVNAGTEAEAPLTDLDGNTRPVDGAFDIGAYEYCTDCMMGSGGSGTGGAGGTNASGGVSSGGASSGGATSGGAPSTGGGNPSGGAPVAAGGSTGVGPSDSPDDGGCGCRVAGPRRSLHWVAALAALLVFGSRRRRIRLHPAVPTALLLGFVHSPRMLDQ